MKHSNLLKQISALAAASALPSVAGASVGFTETSTGSPTATVRLTANLTGTLRLAIYERGASEANPSGGDLATGNITDDSETVNFGGVTVNPTVATPANRGYHLDTNDGAAFIARLSHSLFYTGGNDAAIRISEGTETAPTLSTRGAAADYQWYWRCEATGGLTAPASNWTASGTFTPHANAEILAVAGETCVTYTGAAGTTSSGDADLVLWLDDGASAGSYGADFVYSVSVFN